MAGVAISHSFHVIKRETIRLCLVLAGRNSKFSWGDSIVEKFADASFSQLLAKKLFLEREELKGISLERERINKC